MTIYRVYKSYHDSSSSGTWEYGCFSSLDRALVRVAEVWEINGYQKEGIEKNEYGWYAHNGWESCSINIEHIILDETTDKECNGYT